MRIKKGTFKIRELHDSERRWVEYEGSYATNFPFYIHRQSEHKQWTVSHIATGYALKKDIPLKDARRLSSALKSYTIFLMPTAETIEAQRDKMTIGMRASLDQTLATNGESHEQ